MQTVLVTGANKGIGLALVEAILREQADCRALLGSRDAARGESARQSLLAVDDGWADRVEVMELDVSSDSSVASARRALEETGSTELYALVNNAGLAAGSLAQVLNVNVYGMRRVCEAFVPLLQSGGRVVNVTSAAGPNFVASCDAGRQAFFLDAAITWDAIAEFMKQCETFTSEGFADHGMGSSSAYGLSKACANSYTLYLARCHPELYINACTPGFIDTDLGGEFLGGRTPAQAGMKSPADGARVIMSLLFGPARGTGHYYGSDALRSPMDRYRAPGSPEYTGD